MTSSDKAILGLLNNPNIIPPNDIVHEYAVASHSDMELLVIKVILNININDKGQRGDGERMLYENNFDAYKLSETIIKKILKPLGFRLNEGELIKLIKKIISEVELPESPARRFYNLLLQKGYVDYDTPVNIYTDTLELYGLSEGAPYEYFAQQDGYLNIIVPPLFEEEGGVEIQFEDYDETEEDFSARNDVKDYIAENWNFDFPIDFDDDYLDFDFE